ncbi:MAG TPA: hypothetical protein VFL55_18495 [Acetobacteraceae bacterium]|nr:hypothetical protein [Acetobacteraceae bacterium]
MNSRMVLIAMNVALLAGCAGPQYAYRPPPNPAAVSAARHEEAAQQLHQSAVRQERAADLSALAGDYRSADRHQQAAEIQQRRAQQQNNAARYDEDVARSW